MTKLASFLCGALGVLAVGTVASPQHGVAERAAPAPTMNVKLEWVRTEPRRSETLSLRVDAGERGTATQTSDGGKGRRTVHVQPILQPDGRVRLRLETMEAGDGTLGAGDVSTTITIRPGETVVVKGVSAKKEGASGESLLFVTSEIDPGK